MRIRAALRRQGHQIRKYQNTPENSVDYGQPSTTKRCTTLGSRRTLKILTFTSLAYFTLWTPYVFVVMTQSFVSSFKPPAAVEFTVMWLANTNSAVNVFIYSSTNTQFRRQCVLLASRLCCFRSSCLSSIEQRGPGRQIERNVSTSLPVVRLSTSIMQANILHISHTNTPAIVVTSSREDDEAGADELLTAPRPLCLTVEDMKQAVSINTLASDEDFNS